MRTKDVRDMVYTAIEKLGRYKSIFIHNIPIPTDVKKFPAVAIDIVNVSRDLEKSYGSKIEHTMTVDFYIYNRQVRGKFTTDTYDLLSELNAQLNTYEQLQNSNVVSADIVSFTSDAGVMLPLSVTKAQAKIVFYACEI